MSNKEVERLFELENIKNEKKSREFIADACFVEMEYAKADYDFLLESVEDTFAMEIEATHKELAGLEKRIDALHYVYKYFGGEWSNGIIK